MGREQTLRSYLEEELGVETRDSVSRPDKLWEPIEDFRIEHDVPAVMMLDAARRFYGESPTYLQKKRENSDDQQCTVKDREGKDVYLFITRVDHKNSPYVEISSKHFIEED